MVHFRPATAADVPAILDLLADDAVARSREAQARPAEAAAPDDGPLDAAYAAFAAIDADPRNELVVGDDDGVVVATCQLTFTPSLSRRAAERMTIEAVRVSSDRRGHGLGRQMMEWSLDRARARGCRLVQLTTDKRRTDAQRFYAGLGFAASHEGMKLAL